MAFHLVVGIAKQEGIISAEKSNSCKKNTIKMVFISRSFLLNILCLYILIQKAVKIRTSFHSFCLCSPIQKKMDLHT